MAWGGTLPAARQLATIFRPMNAPARQSTIPVKIGHVTVGGGHPIVVQSMTNTDTADAASTVDAGR